MTLLAIFLTLKITKMAKKSSEQKVSKTREELVEENRRLQALKRSMCIEQRYLRWATRDLKKRIEEKTQQRDYLLYLRAQRDEALALDFANPA